LELHLTLLLCLGAAILNLPFGFYRAGTRKFSWQWFLAIHLPVPLIFVMRVTSDAEWTIIPLLIACALAGQLMGGMIRTGLFGQKAVKGIPGDDKE
jgi:hypothetical protein